MASPYTQFIDAVRASKSNRNYSVILVGSALWDETTVLSDGTPVSDIDLVVIGHSLDELRAAARDLAALFAPFRRDDAPFFKLGLKLRMPAELTQELLCANEFAALTCGRVLRGVRVPFELPGEQWYRRQADLVVPTRIQCNATQRQQLGANDAVLLRYMAARTLLDMPAVMSTGMLDMVGSHAERLARFESKLQDSESFARSEKETVLRHLEAAVRTKGDPEHHTCCTLAEAEALLTELAVRCGVNSEIVDRELFWRSERPLDMRDWELRHVL